MKLGYDINTGKAIESYNDMMVHIGGGEYVKRCTITPEWIAARKEWNESIEEEMVFFVAGLEEG